MAEKKLDSVLEHRKILDAKWHRPSFLLIHMAWHLGCSFAISLALLWGWGDWLAAASAFALGFLLDLDHYLFDYWFAYFLLPNKGAFHWLTYLRGEYFRQSHHRFLWFHSYELLGVLLGLSLFWGCPTLGIGAGLSFGVHLLIDVITYKNTRGLYYFLTFRSVTWI